MANLKELRAAAAPIKRKLNAGESLNKEELETLRMNAAANPTSDTLSTYAMGKHSVKDEE